MVSFLFDFSSSGHGELTGVRSEARKSNTLQRGGQAQDAAQNDRTSARETSTVEQGAVAVTIQSETLHREGDVDHQQAEWDLIERQLDLGERQVREENERVAAAKLASEARSKKILARVQKLKKDTGQLPVERNKRHVESSQTREVLKIAQEFDNASAELKSQPAFMRNNKRKLEPEQEPNGTESKPGKRPGVTK
eukprot:3941687-Rhodomonas_salina.6